MSSGIKPILLLLFILSMESLHGNGKKKPSLFDNINMISDFNLKWLLFSVSWLKHEFC